MVRFNFSLNAIAGAAMYALAPDAIYARRSRHAYGVEVNSAFKRGHRQELRYTEPSTNRVLCKKLFNPLVQLDDLVEHNEVPTASFTFPAAYC